MDASRKRARDGEAAEILQPNKKERIDDRRRYEFHDGIGVFDFPWLKEGVVFEDHNHDDKFSYLDETFAADRDQSQNLCVSVDGDDDFSFLSLVDDLEPVDCIWSSVIDQPLFGVGSGKG
ncbi:uncharacterized protein LOC125191367 [Salvia hispanica]|uniref:uncharacterized protein LOC125191367 n=1 Tax=Salvia hispanica TaxID=49212 RepID=UPI0020097A97|nr:uncharacterized protein LOC125191367 [Salvia hispanica]XP_047944871.1 uncharacterized protein LOC125191367 [Salvia hispanica]